MLKSMGSEGERLLIELCKDIYIRGEWPEDWLKSIMLPLEKKVNTLKCEEHRTISLIVHASKVIIGVVTQRIESKVKGYVGDDQFGFRKGMGTREGISVMRILSERSIEHNQDIYACFVDYEKAFDRVNWVKLMEILKDIGVDWRDRRLIATLYMGQTATVRLGEEETHPAIIGRGNRQGDIISPSLFLCYGEAMIRDAFRDVEDGVKVNGQLIKSVRYADDQATIASTADGLQRLMDSMNRTVEQYGMKINIKKTKVMKIGKNPEGNLDILVNGQKLKQVNQFSYLGSIISNDGYCTTEIKCRIARAKAAFNQKKVLLTKGLNQDLKKRMIKTVIWSVLLYGCETWTLRQEEVRRLEACEMWLWRRMEKIGWTDRVTNEEVLGIVGETRSLMTTIRRRQNKWMGHILRHDGMIVEVLEGRMEGKRGRGRQRIGLIDRMKEGQPYQTLKEKAQNREEWRRCL